MSLYSQKLNRAQQQTAQRPTTRHGRMQEMGASQLADYRAKYEPLLGMAMQRAMGEDRDAARMVGERGMAQLMGRANVGDPMALSSPQRQSLLTSAITGQRATARGGERAQQIGDMTNIFGRGAERRSMAHSSLRDLYKLQEDAADFDSWYKNQQKDMKASALKSVAKIGLGVMTGGASLAFTGV